MVIVLHYPGIRLPNEGADTLSLDHFQYFRQDHIFEKWDRIERRKFPALDQASAIDNGLPMPIRIVWGLKPGKLSKPVSGMKFFEEIFCIRSCCFTSNRAFVL